MKMRLSKNSINIENDNNKKRIRKSAEIFHQRYSKVSNQFNKRKPSFQGSYITYTNKFNYLEENHSFNISELDYKGIEEEIKYTILEMKNNCLLEIRRQSCDELELYKKSQIKSDLENINNSQISELKSENGVSSKRKQYRKSITNMDKIIPNILKKKYFMNNNKTNFINNENTITNSVTSDSFINEKFNIRNSSSKNIKKDNFSEKFRFYGRGGVIEDSFDENESDEDFEEDNFLINPEAFGFLLYDMIIFFASLFSLIFIPYEMTISCYCSEENKRFKVYINYILDILFIIDLIIHFFVEYHDEKDNLIKSRIKIVDNYIKGWFFFDFLIAIPINIIYNYFCKKKQNSIFHSYEKNNIFFYLFMLKSLKAIKIFKMFANKKNQFISKLIEEFSNIPSLNEKISLLIEILVVIFGLHILSCVHIFIGNFTYPSWLFSNEIQNFSFSKLYIISIYYLIQTMTTVGYGDITFDSFIEIIFRIILLAVGIICYSWLISNISNRINKQNYASMNFDNDCLILENIRINHEDLPFKLYSEIKNYLEYKHFHQNIYDKNLLINSLPYTLKNNLIFSMFNIEIERFKYFKGISNTNFLSEILHNFCSSTLKKNEVILNENEIIEEIIFVKDGRLSLELPINMNNPRESANEFLGEEFMNFAFNFDSEDNFKFAESNSNQSISSFLEGRRESHLFHFKSEKLKDDEESKNEKLFYLKIYDILKNEDYGGIYMFYGKRSPFKVEVKTKRAKLYTIKRDDYSNLCDTYKNIVILIFLIF